LTVLADALFDGYFIACELRQRGIELVARAQYQRVGTQMVQSRPDGDIIVWQRPNKPRGMAGEQYRTYPKTLRMRQVSVDARDKDSLLVFALWSRLPGWWYVLRRVGPQRAGELILRA
jgi:hypothetical protein